MARPDNPRFPHYCKITRVVDNEDPMEDEQQEVVIYEGKCRSFTTTTTSDKGEIISSYRKLALPQVQSEWTDDTIPQEGDRVYVEKFGFKEYGFVIDRIPGNLGTHILWKYGRN